MLFPDGPFSSQDGLGSSGFPTLLFKSIIKPQNFGLSRVETSERPQERHFLEKKIPVISNNPDVILHVESAYRECGSEEK